jgi:hypothetical protein
MHAAIAVMDEAGAIGPRVERLLERIESQVRAQRGIHAPADDPSREDVDDERDVDEAPPCRDIGQVRDPELVRPVLQADVYAGPAFEARVVEWAQKECRRARTPRRPC